MNTLKSATLIAVMSVVAGPSLAETVLNDAKSRLYEADYASVLSANGIATGAAVYGQYDADYDVFLSKADVFQPKVAFRHAETDAVMESTFAESKIVASR